MNLDSSKRRESWELLSSFEPEVNKGWCLVGNFNEIVWQSEKQGERNRKDDQMDNFERVLE